MSPKQPILFFPGVMGSRLYFSHSGRYWDPDSYLRMLAWAPIRPFRSDDDNRRTLHFDEPAGVISESVGGHQNSEALGWGGVVWSYYGKLLPTLRQLALDGLVYAVGYDWRQDYRSLGYYAAQAIRKTLNETGAEKVCIAAHSMGGLVVRAAIKSDPELSRHLSKVVFVCQPATGAVVLYRRLFTGLQRNLDGSGRLADRVFRFLLGNSRKAFIGNISGQPGPLQLLPSKYFPKDEEDAFWIDALEDGIGQEGLYLNAESPPGLVADDIHPDPAIRDDFQNRVTETIECHEWLGEPTLPPEIEAWQLAGDERLTEVRIGFDSNQPVPVIQLAGDETVPRLSGTAMAIPPERTFLFKDLIHPEACNHDSVIAKVSEILA